MRRFLHGQGFAGWAQVTGVPESALDGIKKHGVIEKMNTINSNIYCSSLHFPQANALY